jgi:hypothetical protein
VVTEDEPTTLNGADLGAGDRCDLTDGDLIGLADLVFRFIDDHREGVLSRLWAGSRWSPYH